MGEGVPQTDSGVGTGRVPTYILSLRASDFNAGTSLGFCFSPIWQAQKFRAKIRRIWSSGHLRSLIPLPPTFRVLLSFIVSGM